MESVTKLLALLALARGRRVARAARVMERGEALAPVTLRAIDTGRTDGTIARALERCRRACGDEKFAPTCAIGLGTLSSGCWASCAFAEGAFGDPRTRAYVVPGECAEGGHDGERWRAPSWTCANACVALYEPVCGENGMTYSNSCVAECAGVRNFIAGTCHDRDGRT